MRRRFDKIDNVGFSEMLFLAHNFRADSFALNRKRNEHDFALDAANAFSTESDVFDC